MSRQEQLWEAVNRYVRACGGDPGAHVYGNTSRQRAVADIERIAFEPERAVVLRLDSVGGEAVAYLAQLEAVGEVLGQERLDAADGLHYVAVQSLIAEVEARRLRMGRDPKDQRNALGDLPEAQEHYSPPSAGDGEPPWPDLPGENGKVTP
jgi:hypothetical protein